MSGEIPEETKFLVGPMGAMHSDTLNSTEAVMRNLTIRGRQYEAKFHLLLAAILEAMDQRHMMAPHAVIHDCFESFRAPEINDWLLENYGENWQDYTTPKRTEF